MGGLPFTLRQLEVFESICKTKSFRMTSEELGISQAAVSNQIKALEQQLGVRLLARDSGRRPRLTHQGAAFLADLGTFWDKARLLARHRRKNGDEQLPSARRLRVLIGNFLLNDYVKPKLSRFFERHPEIQFSFTSPTIDDLAPDMVDRDVFDLGMFQERVGAALAPGMRDLAFVRSGVFGHRDLLRGSNAPLSVDEVSALPFILPPAATPYESLILTMLARRGVKPQRITGRTQYFDVMSAIFNQGQSVGVSLEPLLRSDHRNIALLYPLEDWRIVFYRNPRGRERDREVDLAEDFLISAVLDDPEYPRIRPAPGQRLGD